MPLAHALEINAIAVAVARGEPRIHARWTWASSILSEQQVRSLADRWSAVLQAFVRHAAQPRTGGRTPSDVPLVRLKQAEIERLERSIHERRAHAAAAASNGADKG
jgi:non-ribosomal peptide synthase protein (TIGR01720 family)